MADDIQFIKFVNKLIELTQNKVIKWEKRGPLIEMISSISKVKAVYYTMYNKNIIRIYEITEKVFEEDFDSNYYWDTGIIMEILSEENDILYSIPRQIDKSDLLKAIKSQELNIDDYINTILQEKK